MTAEEKRVVLAVFGSLVYRNDEDLNRFLGSETIREMQQMYLRLKYEGYCEKHGIKYEDMTVDDFVQAYDEEHPVYEEEEW